MFELHRLGGGPVICALGGLSFFLALLLLALGLLVAVTGGGGRLLKYALGAMAGVFLLLIAAAAMAVVTHHHAVSRVFPVRLAYPSAPMVPLPPPVAPPAPSLPAPPGQPGQAEISPTEAYDNFVVRTRQELDKFSVRFDTLQLSSTNDTHLLITFSGLQELRFADGANAWRDIVGSIAGVKTQGEKWVLEGQDALSVVRFAIAGLDFQKFLAEASLHTNQPATTVGATPAESSHADFAARLAAAEAFPFSETKDRTLGALARDAARVGDVEIVQSALNYSPVASFNEHDAAVHDSVLLLVKAGMRQQAVDIASKTFWSNWNLRDQTLKELAQ